MYRLFLFWVLSFLFLIQLKAEDGYRLWLRYDKIENKQVLEAYKSVLKSWNVLGDDPTLDLARTEITKGLNGMLGIDFNLTDFQGSGYDLIAGTPVSSKTIDELKLSSGLADLGKEGYLITVTRINNHNTIVIAANESIGVFYGVFGFLRLIQTHQDLADLDIRSSPKLDIRILNHWDNLDRTVERGYAGFSIWDWHRLPQLIKPEYTDYARANASIGINATVLTNVNANAYILTPDFMSKVKALADHFRPFGIRVYLTARFSAPVEIGGLQTADPLDAQVKEWWKEKIDEIYAIIPDFGGFLIKANSEGQPGPQNYGRSHADGANMFAEILQPYGGSVMWRAFVYSAEDKEDRAKQAYSEFVPLDGKFLPNVLIQVKNGPIDFQPREPFHPMFGAMPKTPLMMEFQLTQEYLGQATHLVYQAPLYKEVLDADTYAKGKGTSVASIIDGTVDDHQVSGMAGVANIGNDRNWTGHTFAQSNWYCFGRLAWDYSLSAEEIADEWIRMTFSNDETVISTLKEIMMKSREILVNYMTPLGLHHIMATGHHYGPGPWVGNLGRPEWNPVYYHQADSLGIGFDRTPTGSNATSQYFPQVRDQFNDINEIPEKYLLWFHHVHWDYKTKSGKSLWLALVDRYYDGVKSVEWMQSSWERMHAKIDEERFNRVKQLLSIQHKEATWWRNSCLLYFQQFSGKPIPPELEQPDNTLEYYESLRFRNAPGIRPRW